MKKQVEGKIFEMDGWNPTTLEERIQRLEDIEKIKEVMHEYCRCADQNDPDGMIACFTEDCVISMAHDDREGMMWKDRASAQKFYRSALIDYVISGSHFICNEQILFENQDSAIMYMYMYSWQRFVGYPERADCHRWGRYENHYVREADGQWRMKGLRLLSSGEYGGARIGEQFNRDWPPVCTK